MKNYNKKSNTLSKWSSLNFVRNENFEVIQEVIPEAVQQEESRCGCSSILIVDDMSFNVISLQLLIENKFKLKCDTAYSGSEAISKVEERFAKEHTEDC